MKRTKNQRVSSQISIISQLSIICVAKNQKKKSPKVNSPRMPLCGPVGGEAINELSETVVVADGDAEVASNKPAKSRSLLLLFLKFYRLFFKLNTNVGTFSAAKIRSHHLSSSSLLKIAMQN